MIRERLIFVLNIVIFLSILSHGYCTNRPTVEISYFIEETYYTKLTELSDNNRTKARDLIEAYLNEIQTIFHHPSIGNPIDLLITDIYEISLKSEILNHVQNSSQILHQFSEYQQKLNSRNDADVQKWDIAVLITGGNLSNLTNIENVDEIIGQSTIDEACTKRGSVFINFGLYSSLIANQIGQVLGFDFDDTPECPDGQHIMSSSLNDQLLTWSSCSANYSSKLISKACLYDGYKTSTVTKKNLGQIYNANKQCQIFLLNNSARAVPSRSTCSRIWCFLPRPYIQLTEGMGIQLSSAGVPLDGTTCPDDLSKICIRGECVDKTNNL